MATAMLGIYFDFANRWATLLHCPALPAHFFWRSSLQGTKKLAPEGASRLVIASLRIRMRSRDRG